MKKAGISDPYVLVGHSLGALVARLYAGQYPNEVAGMVFVDHAFRTPPPSGEAAKTSKPATSASSNQAMPAPMFMTMDNDPNFLKPSHVIASSTVGLWRNYRVKQQCKSMRKSCHCETQAEALILEHPYPLGDKPLIDVSTNFFRSTEYVKLQADLLSLSHNSKEIVADKSSHFIIIDRPDMVADKLKNSNSLGSAE